jgi:hypothetical protein
MGEHASVLHESGQLWRKYRGMNLPSTPTAGSAARQPPPSPLPSTDSVARRPIRHRLLTLHPPGTIPCPPPPHTVPDPPLAPPLRQRQPPPPPYPHPSRVGTRTQ